MRKYDFSSILLIIPYTYRDFSFALQNFPFTRVFSYTQVWKKSYTVWKISEDLFESATKYFVELNKHFVVRITTKFYG